MPKDSLFQNSLERFVFFTSLISLVFLGLISGFRYLDKARPHYSEILSRLETLEEENLMLKERIEELERKDI